MHQPKEEIPVLMEEGLRTASINQGGMAIGYAETPAGMDITPVLEGLPDDMCQCPHWGYVFEGSLHVRYTSGEEETVEAGDVFYLPAGHTAWVDEDTKWVEFSPEDSSCSHKAEQFGVPMRGPCVTLVCTGSCGTKQSRRRTKATSPYFHGFGVARQGP
jgi:hypothetical protein